MKLPENTNEISGNLVFAETVPMGIDPAAYGIVLESLIRMYGAPYVAALREYSSNAWDSHREAGQTRPVEITTPNRLSAKLIIQDFGVGMNREDLANYGQFGFSTKRDDNEGTGGFGLGSKVGLAFCASYTVTGIKDGFKNTIVIGRDASGAPQLGFVNEEPVATDEPNGVRISLPTSEYDRFEGALSEDFFLGWERGTILVNGKEPSISISDVDRFEPVGDVGFRTIRETHRNQFYRSRNVTALINSVRYDLDLSEIAGVSYNLAEGFLKDVVIRLENGSVDIARSRETLEYTKRTRKYVSERIAEMVLEGRKRVQDEIDLAPTRLTARRLINKAESYGFSDRFTWKGGSVELEFPEAKHKEQVTVGGVSASSGVRFDYRGFGDLQTLKRFMDRKYDQWFVETDHSDNYDTVVLVHSCDPLVVPEKDSLVSIPPHQEHQYAGMWYEVHKDELNDSLGGRIYNLDFVYTTRTPDFFGDEFLEGFSKVVSAADFVSESLDIKSRRDKEARAAAAAKRQKREAADVRVLYFGAYSDIAGERVEKITELDVSKTYVILQSTGNDGTTLEDIARKALTTQTNYEKYKHLAEAIKLSRRGLGYELVVANKGVNTAAYSDTLPNIVTVKQMVETYAANLIKKRTDAEIRAAIDVNTSEYNWARATKEDIRDTIDNPETRAWMKALTEFRGSDVDSQLSTIVRGAKEFGLHVDLTRIDKVRGEPSPGSRYPLLKGSYGTLGVHGVQYINLLDAHLQREAAQKQAEFDAEEALAETVEG